MYKLFCVMVVIIVTFSGCPYPPWGEPVPTERPIYKVVGGIHISLRGSGIGIVRVQSRVDSEVYLINGVRYYTAGIPVYSNHEYELPKVGITYGVFIFHPTEMLYIYGEELTSARIEYLGKATEIEHTGKGITVVVTKHAGANGIQVYDDLRFLVDKSVIFEGTGVTPVPLD
jgi:hypothetical protein